MESLKVIPDLTIERIKEGPYNVKVHDGPMTIGGMPNGTKGGFPAVLVALEVDGEVLVAQTTLSLFLSAADSLKALYGDPRK